MPRGATERQLSILRFVADQLAEKGYVPTIREIGTQFHISSLRGVTVHLDALQRKGLIERANLARTMALTPEGKRDLGLQPDPAEQLRMLEAAAIRYRQGKRLYDSYRDMAGGLSLRGCLEEPLRQAQEALFSLLPPEEG